MNISCAIIDDEPLALDLLEDYVNRTPFLELNGKYSSAIEAMEKTKSNKVDLMFLDIQMPGLSGMEFSRMVDPHTRIVFTTAFEQYALDGFKVNALDYLMKPISYTEFLNSANKALQWFELAGKESKETATTNGSQSTEDDKIFVKSEHRLVGIKLSDILYFESLKDYVLIYVQGMAKPIYTLSSMASIEKNLPAGMFMRVHRSYIIPLSRISLLESDSVIVANKHIPISKLYRPALQEYLSRHTI